MCKAFVLLPILLVVTACATTPVASQNANPTPASRLYADQSESTSKAPVQITRDKGLFGAMCGVVVSIDGQKVAKMAHGETARFYVAPGQHIVGADMTGGICNAGTRETQIQAQAGQTAKLRISTGGGGDMEIAPTAY